jgi:hypothetical protein
MFRRVLYYRLPAVALLSFVAPAMAQENSVAPGGNAPAAPSQSGPTDPAELETFLDELFAKHGLWTTGTCWAGGANGQTF